jgi:XTP/dITP diphosphohydrolase
MNPGEGLQYLRDTMAILRGDDGCAWDREQDHRSLVPFLIEETAELVDAIEAGDADNIAEELGDVLYQVFFHADITAGHPSTPLTIDDIARRTAEKMRTRHPHVFAGVSVASVDEIRQNWIEQKKTEKGSGRRIVDQVPHSLQPIARAHALITRAQRNGVDPGADGTGVATETELGDALLALIAGAVERDLDPDRALRDAMRRLEGAITQQEQTSRGNTGNPSDAETLEEW